MVLSCCTRLPPVSQLPQYIYNLCTNILCGTIMVRSAPRPPKFGIALKYTVIGATGYWMSEDVEERKEQATAHDPPTLHHPAAGNRLTRRAPNHTTIYATPYSRSYSSRKRTCPTRRWTWTRTWSIRLPTTSRSPRACTAARRSPRACPAARRRPWARCRIDRRRRQVPVTRLRPGTSTARSAAGRRTALGRPTSAGCPPKWLPWWPSSGDRPAFWPARNALLPLGPADGCRGPDGQTVPRRTYRNLESLWRRPAALERETRARRRYDRATHRLCDYWRSCGGGGTRTRTVHGHCWLRRRNAIDRWLVRTRVSSLSTVRSATVRSCRAMLKTTTVDCVEARNIEKRATNIDR